MVEWFSKLIISLNKSFNFSNFISKDHQSCGTPLINISVHLQYFFAERMNFSELYKKWCSQHTATNVVDSLWVPLWCSQWDPQAAAAIIPTSSRDHDQKKELSNGNVYQPLTTYHNYMSLSTVPTTVVNIMNHHQWSCKKMTSYHCCEHQPSPEVLQKLTYASYELKHKPSSLLLRLFEQGQQTHNPPTVQSWQLGQHDAVSSDSPLLEPYTLKQQQLVIATTILGTKRWSQIYSYRIKDNESSVDYPIVDDPIWAPE